MYRCRTCACRRPCECDVCMGGEMVGWRTCVCTGAHVGLFGWSGANRSNTPSQGRCRRWRFRHNAKDWENNNMANTRRGPTCTLLLCVMAICRVFYLFVLFFFEIVLTIKWSSNKINWFSLVKKKSCVVCFIYEIADLFKFLKRSFENNLAESYKDDKTSKQRGEIS
jgi:hypothetical protein